MCRDNFAETLLKFFQNLLFHPREDAVHWRVDSSSINRHLAAGRIGNGGFERQWYWVSTGARNYPASHRGRNQWSARVSTCYRYS